MMHVAHWDPDNREWYNVVIVEKKLVNQGGGNCVDCGRFLLNDTDYIWKVAIARQPRTSWDNEGGKWVCHLCEGPYLRRSDLPRL